jgi:YVTN family beta-propeller protein
MRTKNTDRSRGVSALGEIAGAKYLAAAFGLAAVLALLAGCGSSTTAAITVLAAGQTTVGSSPTGPVQVQENDTETFSATVTGISTTTVYWQICLPVPVTSPLTQPTTCTPIPNVNSPTNSPNVTGFGTITQGGVYTAPKTIPQSNSFEVVATSTENLTVFGVSYVEITSPVRIQMIPTAATIGTGESYPVVANVSGSTNTGVTWSVSGLAGGDSTVGTITPGGAMCASLTPTLTPGETCAVYAAPATGPAMTATVTATSSADASQSANTTITVVTAADPTLSSIDPIDPSTTEQGAAQQDIYVQGKNFYSTSQIVVSNTAIPTTWLTTTLMRGTIPAELLAQAASLPVAVERQNGDLSGAAPLSVVPERPSLVASSPDSVITTSAAFGVNLTGGYFSQTATSATFDGFPGTATPGTALATTFASSRQLTAEVPADLLSTPGLYPIVMQNSGIAAGAPSTSFTNIAVTPAAGSLLSAPVATIGVGASPSAIAVDEADGLAVVANSAGNSVSIISLASNTVISTVAVGTAPTGVAIDDAMPAPLHNVAVVVNSGDGTLSTIDLTTYAVTATATLPPLPPVQPNQPAPQYYSIGINPATHHGIVTISSTNVAVIFDTSSGTAAPPPGYNNFEVIGGALEQSYANYGTGPQPQVAIDPRLNWAVVTAGGGGISIVNFVDLGRDPIAGIAPGRAPATIGSLSLASEVTGVGVNPETHQVLLTTPTVGNFTTFSLLDQTVSTVPFTNQNVTLDEPGYVAAAVSALPNIGVAVNTNGNTAAILDLQNYVVVENVAVGNGPDAVAVDPVTNEALVVNQTDGTVSVLSLGAVRSTASPEAPQITLSTPEIGYVSTSPLTLTVNGGGFSSGAQVFLDGTAVPSTLSTSGRQIIATVPSSMLSSARRYAVYVENPGQSVISNIEDLVVVQSVPVGAQPYGVAIDTDCDVAAVTNSGDNTVSILALTPYSNGSNCVSDGAVGTVGPAVPVGTTPQGIAVDPVLSMAVVANSGSLDASAVDLTETNPPSPVALSCTSSASPCSDIMGVGMNLDTGIAYVTTVTGANGPTPQGNLAEITLPTTGFPSAASNSGNISGFDPIPQAVAVDLYLDYDYLGVAVGGPSGTTSYVDVYNIEQGGSPVRATGFNLPTGIIFDPVNEVFVAVNSLQNSIGFVDPISGVATFAQVGMNPTALDYNYQTSTIVTANYASATMSIISYVCPPTIGTGNCAAPQVEDILGLGGSPQYSVAVDRKLNLAVLADEGNNRVVLVPLP